MKPHASRSSFHDCGSSPAYTYPTTEDLRSATKHDDVVLAQLRAEEPGVAFFGMAARRHESMPIELVVSAKEQRAEPAQRGKIRLCRSSNRDGIGHELRLHANDAGLI